MVHVLRRLELKRVKAEGEHARASGEAVHSGQTTGTLETSGKKVMAEVEAQLRRSGIRLIGETVPELEKELAGLQKKLNARKKRNKSNRVARPA
ncbi:hypothetical protein FRC12_022809 [Ceratobasidium sp. 428]|nr:hypothetical protein FRC12_022809 [Ceratobasidium sp. 428]